MDLLDRVAYKDLTKNMTLEQMVREWLRQLDNKEYIEEKIEILRELMEKKVNELNEPELDLS